MFNLLRRSPTLKELLPGYVERRCLSMTTVKRYRSELNRFERLAGPLTLKQVSTATVDGFRQAGLSDGLKPESIESTLKIVHALLAYAVKTKQLAGLPDFGEPLRIKWRLVEPASVVEIDRLFRATEFARWPRVNGIPPVDWWRAWIALAYWTGLRLGDLTHGIGSESLLDEMILYEASKTRKVHVFPRHRNVDKWLARLPMSSCLFGAVCSNGLRSELSQLCKVAKIRRLTAKHLRRAAITQWSIASLTAGKMLHGCGIPSVMQYHYLGVLDVLSEASSRFAWPESMRWDAGQLRLFA